MISIKYGDVPIYLRNSDFYGSLTCEDPSEEFPVPAKCFASDESVETAEQFLTMLHVLAFWGLKQVPLGFFRFGCNLQKSELLSLLNSPGVEIKLAQDLQDIFTATPGQCLTRAMVTGRPEIVTTIVEHSLENLTEDAANTAASLGQLDLLKLLIQRGCPLIKTPGAKSTAEKAASGGNLDCLKYLRELGCEWDKYLLVVAAKGGQENILRYAQKQGLTWRPDESGRPTRFDLLNLNPFIAAVRGNHLACVQYLLDCDSDAAMERGITAIACEHGHLEILKLLRARGALWDEGTCFFAIAHNQFPCLQHLVENGCPMDDQATTHAARNGNLAMLAYVVEKGYSCTSETLVAAVSIKADSFACVQYLVEGKHVPLSAEESCMHIAFYSAVLMGSAETVKYLAAQPGCALNRHVDGVEQLCLGFQMSLEKLSMEEIAVFDDNIVGSLTAAAEVGWDIRAYGSMIVRYMQHYNPIFPKSNKYLLDNGCI